MNNPHVMYDRMYYEWVAADPSVQSRGQDGTPFTLHALLSQVDPHAQFTCADHRSSRNLATAISPIC